MPRRTSKSPARTPAGKTVRADGAVLYVRYSKKVADRICRRIAQGEIWHRICNTDGLPSYTALYVWQKRYPDFAAAYAQAKEMAADLRADRALVVAEEATAATVQADRLRVSTLQWHAAKAAPKRYGPRPGEDDEDAGGGRTLTIHVRQFEKVVREDGSLGVREVGGPDGDGAGE